MVVHFVRDISLYISLSMHVFCAAMQACMLTFYPEFEASSMDACEVIFLLDLSNSMKGCALTEAKKLLLLALHHLPHSATFNIVTFGTGQSGLRNV